jgi:hypothetical protein
METKTVKVHIWHDSDGAILAVGYVPEYKDQGIQIIPQSLENQLILEAEVSEELLNDLQITHSVDIKSCSLVSKYESNS